MINRKDQLQCEEKEKGTVYQDKDREREQAHKVKLAQLELENLAAVRKADSVFHFKRASSFIFL